MGPNAFPNSDHSNIKTSSFSKDTNKISGSPRDIHQSLEKWKATVLIPFICQMMFVSGETAEASVETTSMIEEIVHTQVLEMVSAPALLVKEISKILMWLLVAQTLDGTRRSTWISIYIDI